MKCVNFLCPEHKDYIPNIPCVSGYAERCEARKRYNRIAKEFKSTHNIVMFHLTFEGERNKYHGRKG